MRKKNIHGGGAKTNVNGLAFEKNTEIEDLLRDAGYVIDANNIDVKMEKGGDIVLKLVQKHRLYKFLIEEKKINYKDILSKRLLPDEAIYIIKDNKLVIIEKKFQAGSGSVDEKLQTCDFKKTQYQKLVKQAEIKVEFFYLLNDWFKKDEYRDVLNYIKEKGCSYYYNSIPLEDLGIEINKKKEN